MGTNFQGSKKEVQALNAFIKLKRASESISARLNTEIQKYNLTESQLGILESLYHLGPMCQKDIGQKILKSTGNITLVLDNLEKRFLVKRVRDKDDRRFITVSLTKQGKDLVNKFMPNHVSSITREMSILTSSELETLGKLCKKLGTQSIE